MLRSSAGRRRKGKEPVDSWCAEWRKVWRREGLGERSVDGEREREGV